MTTYPIESVPTDTVIPMHPRTHAPFFSVTVPIAPSVNGSYKVIELRGKNGQTYRRLGSTKEHRAFKKQAEIDMLTSTLRVPVLTAIQEIYDKKGHVPLACDIVIYYEYLWKRDIDGPEKSTIDAVFKFLELNDNLIVYKTCLKTVDKLNPRVMFSLSVVNL